MGTEGPVPSTAMANWPLINRLKKFVPIKILSKNRLDSRKLAVVAVKYFSLSKFADEFAEQMDDKYKNP